MVRQQIKHAGILGYIYKLRTSIPLTLEFNHVCGQQEKRITDQLLDFRSQINIECDVLGKLLVRL